MVKSFFIARGSLPFSNFRNPEEECFGAVAEAEADAEAEGEGEAEALAEPDAEADPG